MRRYSVETTPSAESDIIDSFLWVCEEWGVDQAVSWVNQLRTRILKNLSTFPFKYPIAPERDGSGRDYRQMTDGRYRVIFHIEKSVVRVVHVTGSFAGQKQDDSEEIQK